MEVNLHPNNKGFDWSVPKGPYSYLTKDQVNQFDQEGYLLLEDVFSTEEIKSVIENIDPFEEKVTEALRNLDGGKFFISRAEEITFTTHLVMQNELLKKFTKHEVLANVCQDLIGDNVRLYWDQAVYKKPGTKDEFPWHQDNGYTFVEPQAYLTFWIPLTDATEENGCPWVVPKLHRRGTLEHLTTNLGFEIPLDDKDSISLPVKAGSVAIFSSLTPHRTGPNLTDGIRKTYILQYAPDGAVRRVSDLITESVSDQDRQFLVVKDGQKVD